MKKTFLILSLLLTIGLVFAQTPFTATYTFGANGNVQSFVYNGTTYAGFTMSNIDKVGVTTSSSSDNFRATGWPTTASADAGKYIGFSITAASGYKFTVNTVGFGVGRSGTGTRDTEWRGSADSYNALINNYTTLNSNLTNNSGVLNNPDLSSNWSGNILTMGTSYADITNGCGFRVYLYTAEAAGGTAGLAGPITITGTYQLLAGNNPPIITNIVPDPTSNITSSTTVSVSADVTDADGTVSLVQLKWGTAPGTYPNTITMNVGTAPSYNTATSIPAQANGTTVYYVVYAEDDEAASTTSIEMSYTVADPSPTITVSPTTLTGFTYVIGNGPSTEKTFTVSGSNLTADISIAAPTDYEISTGTGVGFIATDPIVLTQTDGTVPTTSIYVRLVAGLPIGTYNSENIVASSTDATDKTVACSGSVTAPPPSATVLMRPSQIDISAATSESAVLVQVQNYTSDSAKYRLYNGSNQYNCWDTVTNTYISSTTYSDGPSIPGTPTTSSTWWITFQRGNNATTVASYRDRLTPYTSNHLTAALPTATAITTPESISNSQVDFNIWNDYTAKYVILAFDATTGGNLISNTSAALTSGIFDLKVESGTTIYRIEVRDLLNNLVETVTGTWPVMAAEAPTFDPVGGTYYTAQSVTLSSATTGASIYYSIISGTGPWTAYTGPISVAVTTTLWAYASLDGMEDSAVVSATYTIPQPQTTALPYLQDFTDGFDDTYAYSVSGTNAWYIYHNTTTEDYIAACNGFPLALAEDWLVLPGINFDNYSNEVMTFNTLATYGTIDENNYLMLLYSTDYPGVGAPTGYTWIEIPFTAATVGGGEVPSGILDLSGITGTNVYIAFKYYSTNSATRWEVDDIHIYLDEGQVPVELASFTALISADNLVTLTWVTQTETGMNGYYIYRAASNSLSGAEIVSPMIAATNTSQQQSYQFTDAELFDTGTYYYWLQSVDLDGSGAFHGPVSVYYNAFGDNPTPEIPTVTELKAIYPNPFNPVAFIPYSIADASEVSFKIYNSRGQIVRHFDLGNRLPGSYRITWDGTDFNGRTLSNGVYYIMMSAGHESFQRKAVLMK